MKANEVHKEYENEEKKYKKQMQLWITRNKYFKTQNINFLTWAEKDQIRNLNQQDPEEWNIDKLAECFPADPFIISKILKAKWIPKNEERIEKHDLSVKKSWEMLKQNKLLDLNPELLEHLKKFSSRKFDETNTPNLEKKALYDFKKPTKTEFLNIITSCKNYAKPDPEIRQIEDNSLYKVPDRTPNPNKDSFVLENKLQGNSKLMTFKTFQETSPEFTRTFDEPTQIEAAEDQNFNTLRKMKNTTSEVAKFVPERDAVFKSLEIKENIVIPRKLWKKGKTYQVDDCFYDDDGEFLYRVPGFK